MAQSCLGIDSVYAYGAVGCCCLGDWVCCDGRGPCWIGACGSAWVYAGRDSSLVAAGLLRVLGCVWVGADFYSAALAALVLQLAVWNGVVAGACCVPVLCRGLD